jgi:hypothetical protein
MDTQTLAPSTQKVRRDALGGKRGDGHQRNVRIRRADARRIRIETTERRLTGVAGLAAFGAFARKLGVEQELRRRFERLKTSPLVIYPMPAQMRLLIDATLAGEDRVFGLEALAADPLFVHLAGGVVPSIDTVYRDLCRFDDRAIEQLEQMVAAHGLALVRRKRAGIVHLDIDSTVEPLFGAQQGARPGPNPHYHGRPSYHPLLARVAEVDAVVGAVLRPGDTGFGADVVPFIERCIDRTRAAVGPNVVIYTRIDGAADCAAILDAIDGRGAFFVTKAKITADLCGVVAQVTSWKTVDIDADGRPRVQVAEIPFARGGWRGDYRVIAVRSRDRWSGKQVFLWNDLDYTVQVFITNAKHERPEDIARRYDLRAGIEPLIAELKNGFGMGKVPSQVFEANHAAMLLKVLAYNLLRRFLTTLCPALVSWRAAWARRVLVNVPGLLLQSGRSWTLRVPKASMLARLE